MTCFTEEGESAGGGLGRDRLNTDMSSVTHDKSHMTRAKSKHCKKPVVMIEEDLMEYGSENKDKNKQMARNALVNCGLGRPKSNYMRKGQGFNAGTVFNEDHLLDF